MGVGDDGGKGKGIYASVVDDGVLVYGGDGEGAVGGHGLRWVGLSWVGGALSWYVRRGLDGGWSWGVGVGWKLRLPGWVDG